LTTGIAGSSYAPVTDAEVRTRLRALFDSGVLPREVNRTVFAGRSQGGGRCVACDVPFRLGEIEYEVDIGKAPLPVVHRRCLELWVDEERDGRS
jgi:hypothetical protein